MQGRFAEWGKRSAQRVNFGPEALQGPTSAWRFVAVRRNREAVPSAVSHVRAFAGAVQHQQRAIRRSPLAAPVRRCYTPICFQTQVLPI